MSTWIAIKIEDNRTPDEFSGANIGKTLADVVANFKNLLPNREIRLFTDDSKLESARLMLSANGVSGVQVTALKDGAGNSGGDLSRYI